MELRPRLQDWATPTGWVTPYRSSAMAGEQAETNAGPESGQPDFKWAVEWLVRKSGQRRAAAMLGVNRKTVALALRRDRLTSRMNHAVQTLIARVDDPVGQEVMPLDRMESQIRFLLESMDELDDLIEKLTHRVKALEEAQSRAQAEAKVDGEAHEEAVPRMDEVTEAEHEEFAEGPAPGPEREQAGRGFGWWRR